MVNTDQIISGKKVMEEVFLGGTNSTEPEYYPWGFYKVGDKWIHSHGLRSGKVFLVKDSEVKEKDGKITKSKYCSKCFVKFVEPKGEEVKDGIYHN